MTHSLVAYNVYDTWGLPIPEYFDDCFVDNDSFSWDTGKKHAPNDIGSRVYTINIFNDANQYYLWSVFDIEEVTPFTAENGKERYIVKGSGWMLNPPQELTGRGFDQFISKYTPRFGFQRIDNASYLSTLDELANEYRRPDWDQDTLDFCRHLWSIVSAEDTDVHRLMKHVQEYLEDTDLEDSLEEDVPESQDEAVERVSRAIRLRRGQPLFRQLLLTAYGGRCAVTGCNAQEALEAAHIIPYNGEVTNSVTNGLLLRADIHTLFDLGLLRINPQTRSISLDGCLAGTPYCELEGKRIAEPTDSTHRPTHFSLSKRWEIGGIVSDDITTAEL